MRLQLICTIALMPVAAQALGAQCPSGPTGWRNDTDFKVRM